MQAIYSLYNSVQVNYFRIKNFHHFAQNEIFTIKRFTNHDIVSIHVHVECIEYGAARTCGYTINKYANLR